MIEAEEKTNSHGENTKNCELQGKALHARIRWMRKKRKQEGNPEEYPVAC